MCVYQQVSQNLSVPSFFFNNDFTDFQKLTSCKWKKAMILTYPYFKFLKITI